MAEGTREMQIDGHTVRITGGDEPLRPFRGFFSGDELPGEHRMPTGAGDAPPPADMVVIEVDGAPFEAHRLTSGYLHLHTVPFRRFSTVDDAAREIVRLIDLGVLRGGA
ncbi:MAG TPA: hypothetical protein VFF79_08290 [Conexibacter sp.]|nr:hypothetical protein [Conexibacter sp.]